MSDPKPIADLMRQDESMRAILQAAGVRMARAKPLVDPWRILALYTEGRSLQDIQTTMDCSLVQVSESLLWAVRQSRIPKRPENTPGVDSPARSDRGA